MCLLSSFYVAADTVSIWLPGFKLNASIQILVTKLCKPLHKRAKQWGVSNEIWTLTEPTWVLGFALNKRHDNWQHIHKCLTLSFRKSPRVFLPPPFLTHPRRRSYDGYCFRGNFGKKDVSYHSTATKQVCYTSLPLSSFHKTKRMKKLDTPKAQSYALLLLLLTN